MPCNRSHGRIWNYLGGEHSEKIGKKRERMTGQQRKLGRSAGELEGKQANGMMPKSMQGNVSRRQHVSGLKAVFHFVEAWDAIFFPTIKPLD